MISTNDVKPGMALALDNGLFTIVEYQHVKPGKGKAFVRMKIKNVETGQVLDRTFRAGEDVDRAIIDRKEPLLAAFAVWDGEKEDRNGRKVISVWQRLNIMRPKTTAK